MSEVVPKKLSSTIWQMKTWWKKMKGGEAVSGTSWIDLVCKNQLKFWVKDGRPGFSSHRGHERDAFCP